MLLGRPARAPARIGGLILCVSRGLQTETLCGHRCRLAGPAQPLVPPRPPLVLIGGTAQTIDSWAGHVPKLSRHRLVLCYETAGQAGAFNAPFDLTDCGLGRHAADFARVVHAAGLAGAPVDVCGFSFGGRVALAAAAGLGASHDVLSPPDIRRLALTGVAADRGAVGRGVVRAWGASLGAGDLREFARNLIRSTYSARHVAENQGRIDRLVDATVAANSLAGLRAIVEQTHTDDPSDPTHPLAMARKINSAGDGVHVERGQLLVGAEDTLSPVGAARELADVAGWEFGVIDDAGHAVPAEQPAAWRSAVADFLDAD